MADEEKTEEVAEKSGGGILENKFVWIGLIVVIQAVLAFAAVQFLIRPALTGGAAAQAVVEEEAGPARGVLVPLEELVISLNTAGRPRYLRTSIALEARGPEEVAEITERMPQFRDVAIMTLSRYKADELGTVEGKEAVKAKIRESLQEILDEGAILDVYFSDFVIQ